MKVKTYAKLMIMFLMALILPLEVEAASVSVSPSSLSVSVGETKTFTIIGNDCEGAAVVSSSNSAIVSVESVTKSGWIDATGVVVTVKGVSAGSTNIVVSLLDGTDKNNNPFTGSYNVSVTVTNPSSDNSGSNSGGSSSGDSSGGGSSSGGSSSSNNSGSTNSGGTSSSTTTSNSSNKNLSSNTNLKSLSVKGCTLSPSFTKTRTSYTCSEFSEDYITISATKEDSKSSLAGTGKRTLKSGKNTLYVTVTAENGSKKSYTIVVNKKDSDKNNDNTLSSLIIEGQNIEFNKDKTEYDLEVASTVEYLEIKATATNDKATVTGTGKVNLVPGENKIEVVVTSEDGAKKTYTINCIRSDKDNIPSTTLTNLKYNDNNINLDTDEDEFTIGLTEYTDSIKLDYETSSKTTKYIVEGEDDLKAGINKVTIRVMDEGCEDRVYTLYVYVPEKGSKVVTKDDDISALENDNLDVIYNSFENENHVLPDELIDLINNSNKTLTYNIVNENNGVLYSFELDKNSKIQKGFKFRFIKVVDKPLKYSSNIPKGIKITAYMEGKYKNDTKLKLYKYDEENDKYILIKDNIKVEDGYISFVSDGSSEYIFSKTELKKEVTLFEWIIRILFFILGVIVATLIHLIRKRRRIMKKLKAKQKKQMELEKQRIIENERDYERYNY